MSESWSGGPNVLRTETPADSLRLVDGGRFLVGIDPPLLSIRVLTATVRSTRQPGQFIVSSQPLNC
jgi:hypothetical protein